MTRLAHLNGHGHTGPPMRGQLPGCDGCVMRPRHWADGEDAGKALRRVFWIRVTLFEFQLAACYGVNCIPPKKMFGS